MQKRLNSPITEEIFSGSRSLTNANEALEVAKAFWEITALASSDHLNNVPILNNEDIVLDA
jgi:hypothetical protein